MVEIRLERTIAAPVEEVFDWLADPASLKAAPLVLKSGWAKNSPSPDTTSAIRPVREVVAAGTWFREEITAYDRPHSYTYLILRSFPPMEHEGGTLTFTPDGDGTRVEWVTNYTHPAAAGGKVLERVTKPILRSSFMAILNGCAKALEK